MISSLHAEAALVLFSGGQDSTVCLAWALERFALAHEIGGEPLIDLLLAETHTCYLGDRRHQHAWGFGCGRCPACRLRAEGFAKWKAAS
jgi:7-cyano-7-deazaguanine synthase in queuosine biosynthesis